MLISSLKLVPNDDDHFTTGISEEHLFASIVGNNKQLAKVLMALFLLKYTGFPLKVTGQI